MFIVLLNRYNGILGEYPTNSHDITTQMLQKFLNHQKVNRMELPDIVTAELRDILKTDNTSRGTLFAVDQDIEQHSILALSPQPPCEQYCFSNAEVSELVELGKATTSFIPVETVALIEGMYQVLFPNAAAVTIEKHVTFLSSVCYLGEYFRPDLSDTTNCNIVCAKWLKSGYDLTICLSENCARAGRVAEILLTHHNIDGLKGQLLLLKVDWFSMHDNIYGLGETMQLYHKPVCPPGTYSYLPIQRVISKCAQHHCQFENVSVRCIIPLAGKWALAH